jgi:4-amino-4-deoxy-L-arabinose transferase-like glycosyltransferase
VTQHNLLKWSVLGLCLLSFVLGAYELGEQSLWWDESLSHYRATRSFSFILSNQIYLKSGQSDVRTLDNHPPLYFVLLRLVILAAGDSEFALRFLSLAAGTTVVPLLYVCGRRLFGPPGGTLAASLGALSPLYLWYQQEARPYTLLVLFGTLSFYALLRVLAPSTPSKPARRYVWSVVFGLSIIATLTTHYLGFFLLVAQVMILFLAWRRLRGRLAWLLVLVGVVAIVILVWGMQAIPQQARLPGYDFIPWFTLLGDVFQQFTLGLYADSLAPFRWLASGLLLASVVILFARRRHVPWSHTVSVLLCFLLPIIGIYALSVVRPAYMNVRHLIYASPFYYLLLGGGVGQAWQIRLQKPAFLRSTRLGWVLSACLACVLIGMGCATSLHYHSPLHTKEDHREWGRYLSQHVRPQDLVIVNPGPISQLYLYYVDSEAPWFGLPFLGGDSRSTTAYLEQLSQQVDRVWVAYSSTPGWANLDNVPLTWLGGHAMRVAFASFESQTTTVQVHGFLLNEPVLDTLPEECSPLALDFDDQLLLACITSPVQATAGDVIQLSLFWLAPHPLEQDYRVALSLVDNVGYSWAAHDYIPVTETYPTSRWPTGPVIRDDIDLPLPPGTPPGRYQLTLSVYPADQSGPALAVRDSTTGDLKAVVAV